MANFVLIVDPDSSRREAFLQKIAGEIAPIPGLTVGSVQYKQFGAVWAASPHAPVSTAQTARSATIVWGHPIARSGSQPLDAEALGTLWGNDGAVVSPFDGYYAAATMCSETGLCVGADLLGLFPLYYTSVGESLLVASSPEPFSRHPLFEPALDIQGLIGVLLTHGLPGGRTLLKGVQRVTAGHVLRWWPDGRTQEIQQYSIPAQGKLSALSFDDQVAALDAALKATVHRHVAGRTSVALLLSGGRDSRLLAGYLRDAGITLDAITFGRESDYEVRCARAVGRKLGAAHVVRRLPEREFPTCAELQATWEHLTGGFSTVHTWGMIGSLEARHAPIVSGHVIDRTIGGRHMISEGGPLGQVIPFDRAYSLLSRSGIERAQQVALMRHDAGKQAVNDAYERMRFEYESLDTVETQRLWRFDLAYVERFHVGPVPWRLSFGAWPILPVLDQDLLATVAGMHTWTLANRRAQDHLLCTRFPDLAAVILDRNAHNIDPLLPTRWYRTRRRTRQWLARVGLGGRRVPADLEPRYYYRIYDLNRPGWREVRRRAEPFRESLEDILDMDALAAYLPPPDETIQMNDLIEDGAGRKLLIGLMLWRGRHGW